MKDGYLIDLDGTLYRGTEAIVGADDFLRWLEVGQIPYLLVTNCPSHTASEVVQKLDRMGIRTTESHVLTCGMAAAEYLSQNGFKNVYLIGESAVRAELERAGISMEQSQQSDCVLVAWDRDFTYNKLNEAMRRVAAGARLFCTNSDNAIPDGSGMVAHTGAICAAVECACGVQATYIGKPERIMADCAIRMIGLPAERLIVIGDRLDTDILFAKNNGMRSVLTLTGCTKEISDFNLCVPTAVVKNLQELYTISI